MKSQIVPIHFRTDGSAADVQVWSRRTVINCRINMTANDWELYTASFDADDIANVANKINEQLEVTLSCGVTDAADFEDKGYKILAKFRKFGADDTEPRYHLRNLCRKLFGEDAV